MLEAGLANHAREALLRGYAATMPAADIESTRLRMAGWAPVVAIASIRWWLDRVAQITQGNTAVAMAGRSPAYHQTELQTRLDLFDANWPS